MSKGESSVEVVSVIALGTKVSKVEEALIQNSLLVIKDGKGSFRTFWCGTRLAVRFEDGKIFDARVGGAVLFDFASERPSFQEEKLRAVHQYGDKELLVHYDPGADRILSFVR